MKFLVSYQYSQKYYLATVFDPKVSEKKIRVGMNYLAGQILYLLQFASPIFLRLDQCWVYEILIVKPKYELK